MTFAIWPTDPCPCGSGKPYEECCGRDTDEKKHAPKTEEHRHEKKSHGCGCGD